MPNRSADRGGRSNRRRLRQSRITLIKLIHLAQCAPAQITVTRLPEVGLRHFFDATLKIELCSQLVSEALVLDKPILVRRPDRLLVEAHGIEIPAFYTGELGCDEDIFVLKGRGTVLSPFFQLREVPCQQRQQFELAIR